MRKVEPTSPASHVLKEVIYNLIGSYNYLLFKFGLVSSLDNHTCVLIPWLLLLPKLEENIGQFFFATTGAL